MKSSFCTLFPGCLAGPVHKPVRRTLQAVALAAACIAAAPASAQSVGSTFWHIDATGCTPTDATLRGGQYATPTDGGYVRYRSGNGGTAPLTFICPVSAQNTGVQAGDATHLFMYHQDPDGAGSNHQVRATLKSFHKSSGAYDTDVCQVISDSPSAWGVSSEHCTFVTGGMNFDEYYYWVEVVLTRTVTGSLSPRFMGVALMGVIE